MATGQSAGILQLHVLKPGFIEVLSSIDLSLPLIFCLRLRGHATVDDLNPVTVEDFVEHMIFREPFIVDFKEHSSDVGSQAFAKRWVIPNDVSVAVPSGGFRRLWYVRSGCEPVVGTTGQIILQAKSSLFYSSAEAWGKKALTNLFDATMRSYDGAEPCELVGAYLLHKIKEKSGNTCIFGSYRDDGIR